MMSGRLQPALLGGLFIGVLSALPIISAGNCCCCLWVIAGGALAAYLRQQNSPYAINASEGALIGLMAGVIGGVVHALLSIPMMAITGPMQQQLFERMMSSNPEMPAEIRDILERAAVGPTFRAVTIVLNLIVDTVFGLLGGVLGAAIFKKNAPPPPPPPGTVDVLPPE
jgi:hypothetical protein